LKKPKYSAALKRRMARSKGEEEALNTFEAVIDFVYKCD